MPLRHGSCRANYRSIWLRAAAAALLGASALSASALAQSSAPSAPLTDQQRALQKDWSMNGTWMVVRLGFSGFMSEEEYLDPKVRERFPPPLNAEARNLRETIRQELSQGKTRYNPTANCMPVGVPYLLAYPASFEIQFSDKRAMMLYDNREYRLIYTDGRGHPDPDDFLPGFFGHSIGRWEGASFVVSTMGIRGGDKMQIEPHIPFTEAMQVDERWTQTGPDELKVEVTMFDPGIMTAPWKVTQTMLRTRNSDLIDAVCMENNRNPTDATGQPLLLGPDGKPLH
jgi:hypothetical protein